MNGNRLKEIRAQLKISQVDLSNRTGINQFTISNIERGIDPSNEVKGVIARALEVPVSDVWPREDERG